MFVSRVQGVLGLYREVSAEIAEAIGAALSEKAEARLAERPTVDPQVIEYVLRGRFHLRRFTPEDLDVALNYFEAALETRFPLRGGPRRCGRVWAFRAQMNLVDFEESIRFARPHAERALELDPGNTALLCGQATSIFLASVGVRAGNGGDRSVPGSGSQRCHQSGILWSYAHDHGAPRRGPSPEGKRRCNSIVWIPSL